MASDVRDADASSSRCNQKDPQDREQIRLALHHMRIPLWRRHDQSYVETAAPISSGEASSAAVGTQTQVAGSVEVAQAAQAAEVQTDAEQVKLPTNFQQLTSLSLVPATTTLPDAAILVVALQPQPFDTSVNTLLARMMLAIDVPQNAWVPCLTGNTSVTLTDLLSQQAIRGVILLSPAQHVARLNALLTSDCDNAICSVTQNDESTVLAGKLPQTRVSFCCLTDPRDLMTDGSLKRQAWDTLQAMQKSMTGY